jgi:hypothetical protein
MNTLRDDLRVADSAPVAGEFEGLPAAESDAAAPAPPAPPPAPAEGGAPRPASS